MLQPVKETVAVPERVVPERVFPPPKTGCRMTNGVNRRSVFSQPISCAGLKDQTVRLKFSTAVKQVSQLQYCSTFAMERLRNLYPKSQHFMFTYDELVEKPHYQPDPERSEPCFIFLAPVGVDREELGRQFQIVGKAMEEGSGDGYYFAKDTEEYKEKVFGKKEGAGANRK